MEQQTGLTESQLQQIKEKVQGRYPEPKHWACASAKMQRKRAMEAYEKRLIEEVMRKKIYNDDLAA